MITVVLEYRLHNDKALILIDRIFKKVLHQEYQIIYLVNEYFSADDYATIKDKEYEAKIVEPVIDTDIIVSLGARCSKYFSKEKLLNKSITSSYEWNGKKVYTNYSPVHVINNYESYVKKFIEQFDRAINGGGNVEAQLTKFKIIDSIEELDQVIEWCIQEETFCFDFETTGLVWFKDVPTILSISFNPGFSYILPLFHYDSIFIDETEILFEKLKVLFENPKVVKYGHNLKFDLHFILRYCTKTLRGRYVDSMLMHHILDENSKHGLKDLVTVFYPEYANYELAVKGKDWAKIDLQTLSQYAAMDTDLTLRLCIQFESELINDDESEKLYTLYRNYTTPALLTFLKIEHRGALINADYIVKSIQDAEIVANDLYTALKSYKEVKRFEISEGLKLKEQAISELEAKLVNAKPHMQARYNAKIDALLMEDHNYEINFNSPKQLGDLLFSKEGFNLPLYYDKFTKEYVRSTSRDTLKVHNHPFLNVLFEYRTVLKLVSTYYEGILEKLDDNNYLHTSFLLHGTTTGRLSSKEPNLQNLPAAYKYDNAAVGDLYKRVKKFFITPKDRLMFCCDFSQAELRCIANFSQDETMIDAYVSGKDLHTITAASIEKCTVEEFLQLDENYRLIIRNAAKTANFGYVYGSTVDTYIAAMYSNTGKVIDVQTATTHRNALFNTYLGLTKWHKTYIRLAEKYGYVRTLFGRKRRLVNINNKTNHKLKAADERVSINAPIQGTSGEWTVFSMILLDIIFGEEAVLFNNIHDALYLYVIEEKKDLVKSTVSRVCSYPLIDSYFNIDMKKVRVKMKMDIDICKNYWGEK